jgi:hypothetical protein
VGYVMSHGKRIEVETCYPCGVKPKKKQREPFKAEFVQFSVRWAEALQQSKSAATYQLAIAILFESYKRKHIGGEIVLSSVVTKMSKETRRRATNELVKFGLIEVKRNGRKSPRVTKLHTERP